MAVGLTAVAIGSVGAGAALPDGRGYEMVSPPDKAGGDVISDGTRTRASVDGSAVAFVSLAGFGDIAGTGIAAEYLGRRNGPPDTRGWTTHGILPKVDPLSPNAASASMDTFYMGDFSDDLSSGVLRTLTNLSGDPNLDLVTNLYLRADLLSAGAGSYVLVSSCPICIAPLSFVGNPSFADATPDFGQVIFESRYKLVDEAPASGTKLYEWDHGALRLAGILPVSEGGGAAPNSIAGAGVYTLNVLSDGSDGHSRIFFRVSTGRLYMRVDHAATVQVDASENPTPGIEQPSRYEIASVDGSRVFFTNPAQLTADDGSGLYMYDATLPDTDPANLSLVSVDSDLSDGGPDVSGVLGASDDGSYVYFMGRGRLVPGQPNVPDSDKIYLWHAGVVSYVGALTNAADVGLNRLGTDFGTGRLGSRVSSDGRHLLITAHSGVGLTGYDHGSACGSSGGEPCTEVYLYDVYTDSLVCASCNPSGATATSDASFSLTTGRGGSRVTSHLVHALSSDGSRVFFTSGERLVPQDRNGKARDAYEYEAATGQIHLISSGNSPDGSYFLDASENGDDVFFTTRERLVGWDVDNSYDLYDARVGGGFPEPRQAAVECSGDACRGPLGILPGIAALPTGGFVVGAQNVERRSRVHAKRCGRGKVRKRVNGKVTCVKRKKQSSHRGAPQRPHSKRGAK
ncbi:MAG: hypothetical protein WBD55_04150 [Dehalococcoidia bacterium]